MCVKDTWKKNIFLLSQKMNPIMCAIATFYSKNIGMCVNELFNDIIDLMPIMRGVIDRNSFDYYYLF